MSALNAQHEAILRFLKEKIGNILFTREYFMHYAGKYPDETYRVFVENNIIKPVNQNLYVFL